MARKPLPTEIIVGLYHQLANLSAKHPDRNQLIKETAQAFNVSLSTGVIGVKNHHSVLYALFF